MKQAAMKIILKSLQLIIFILFKTLKLLQTMNIHINTIRNNVRVTKTKMCVTRYTNEIWAKMFLIQSNHTI